MDIREIIEKLKLNNEINVLLVYSDFIQNPMFIFFLLTILTDVIIGNLYAFKKGVFSSVKAVNGTFKHLGILTFTIIILPLLSALVGSDWIVYILIIYFSLQYLVSIIENLNNLGIEFPEFFKKYLAQFKDEGDFFQ